jgi:hypothetical protein
MVQNLERVTKWAPIVGRWEISEGAITYLGPQQEQLAHPIGICISNSRFSEGEAKALVHLPEKFGGTGDEASGRILLGYKSLDLPYVMVGLGGYNRAYAISQFEPGLGWRAVAVAGSWENLVPSKTYELMVQVSGQRLTLAVDDVRVLDHVLEAPLPEGQLGLSAWGEHRIEFRDITVRSGTGTAFVIMQFSNDYQDLYSDVIRPVVEKFRLNAYHAGEVFRPGIILEDIVHGIVEAKVIIAEITPPNQNVFYELGYAHALRKPTILLAEEGKTLPFDISGYRCLFYENSIGGKRKVEEGLIKHLNAILNEGARLS